MEKLMIAKKENYEYTLKDTDNGEYQLNMEFYNVEKDPEVGDILFMSEKLLQENNAVLSFDTFESEYGRKIENALDDDIVVLMINEEKIYLKTKISHKLDSHYELKYSKSKNVYTLYYLESYIVSEIDDINKLLSQKFYEQELLDLSHYPIAKEIKGIKLVDSISILDDKDKLNLLKKNLLCYSKGKMVIK